MSKMELRPPDVSAKDEWTVNHQIVVPRVYRPEILNLAHETPMSGHLGVNKTYYKILNHFYWPGLKSDVSQFCKSCNTCQMVGKPNQTIPKAHLQPILDFDELFSRIIIDCVGPLPKTKSGHEYLRTIMCASTRFPEAIPLRNIKTKIIVKALVKFFTFVGLPKSVQSDQGSNFMSGIFQQVIHELGITQYKSLPYHPKSQSALERFHQTLKNMIRSYCFDTEKKIGMRASICCCSLLENLFRNLLVSAHLSWYLATLCVDLWNFWKRNFSQMMTVLWTYFSMYQNLKTDCLELVRLIGPILSQHKGKWNVGMMKMQTKENSCLETGYLLFCLFLANHCKPGITALTL